MHVSEWRWLAQMSGGQQAAGKEPTKASGVSRSLAGGASPPPFSSIFLPLFDPVCLFCSILFHYLNTCAYFPFFAIIWSPLPFLFHLIPLFPLIFLTDKSVFLNDQCYNHGAPTDLLRCKKRDVTHGGPQLTFQMFRLWILGFFKRYLSSKKKLGLGRTPHPWLGQNPKI